MPQPAILTQEAVIEEFRLQLAEWQRLYVDRPGEELTRLWLLALEREQIVTIAYRRDIIEERLGQMPIDADVARVIGRAVRWTWRDEEMHALYMRGVLLGREPWSGARAQTWLAQLEGKIAGWTSSRQHHHRWSERPGTRALAELLELAGAVAGKIPAPARAALGYSTFADFCRFNVAAERTAGLGWGRIAELADTHPELGIGEEDRAAFRAIAADEDRHARVFELFAESFTPDDRLLDGLDAETLERRLEAVGQRFVALPRPGSPAWRNPLGKGAPVFVRECPDPADETHTLDGLLEALELPEDLVGRSVAIMTAFMMAVDRNDPSPAVSVSLLHALGWWLAARGAKVTVLESANIFDLYHEGRSVAEVATYLGVPCEAYEVIDTNAVQVQHTYLRGLDLASIAAPWRDADLRILFGKLRGHPVTGALLTLEVAEGLGGRNDHHQFADRRADRQLTVAMLLDAFAPDIALLDATRHVPDGLMGMMGSKAPRHPGRLYGSRDAVSLDLVAARHIGAREGQIQVLDLCRDWFGDPTDRLRVDGPDTPLPAWTPADHSPRTALLSRLAMPVYAHVSAHGQLFLPDFDERAFPPKSTPSAVVTMGRGLVRRLIHDRPEGDLLPTVHLDLPQGSVRLCRLGEGEPIVLLHGYPETLQLFARLAPELARTHAVFAFDWPGQGFSDRWAGPCTPQARAAWLETLLDALELHRAHLVATDMGAHPALALAALRPDRVASVVAMNALLFGDGPTSVEVAVMRRAGLARLAFTQAAPVVYARCKQTFLSAEAARDWPIALDEDFGHALDLPHVREFLADLCEETERDLPNLPALYWKIDAPILALWAERDTHFPLAHAERLVQLVRHGRLTTLPTADHWMAWTHAAEVAAAIRSFAEMP